MRSSSDTTYSVSLPQIESFHFLFSGGVTARLVFLRAPWWLSGGDSARNAGDTGDTGLISGLGRSPGGGLGNTLHYSCLENPMDRGAWQAVVHGVAKSWAWLKWLEHDLSKGQIWMSQKSFKCDCFLYQTQQCISLVVSVFIFLLHTSASLILLASALSQS